MQKPLWQLTKQSLSSDQNAKQFQQFYAQIPERFSLIQTNILYMKILNLLLINSIPNIKLSFEYLIYLVSLYLTLSLKNMCWKQLKDQICIMIVSCLLIYLFLPLEEDWLILQVAAALFYVLTPSKDCKCLSLFVTLKFGKFYFSLLFCVMISSLTILRKQTYIYSQYMLGVKSLLLLYYKHYNLLIITILVYLIIRIVKIVDSQIIVYKKQVFIDLENIGIIVRFQKYNNTIDNYYLQYFNKRYYYYIFLHVFIFVYLTLLEISGLCDDLMILHVFLMQIIFQMFENISKKKVFDLVTGTAVIYLIYFLASLLQEGLIKNSYKNSETGDQQKFTNHVGLVISPVAVSWLVGFTLNKFSSQVNHIPCKHSIMCASMVFISTFSFTVAIFWTNFPIVMMVKSCNILSVIIVGVFCTRVTKKELKLDKKKIISGIIITIGIFTYNLLGKPDEGNANNKNSSLYGIILLLISLVADGFLPDFQAEIKSKFTPRPMEMFEQINKWVTILSFIYIVITNQAQPIFYFIIYHPQFALYLFFMSSLSAIGQIFIYRMIQQFKQHVVPFVITTRKIFTVLLSIIFYNHQCNIFQVLGIIIVFGTVCIQFLTEIKNDQSTHQNTVNVMEPQKMRLKETYFEDQLNEIQAQSLNIEQDELQTKIERQINNHSNN